MMYQKKYIQVFLVFNPNQTSSKIEKYSIKMSCVSLYFNLSMSYSN